MPVCTSYLCHTVINGSKGNFVVPTYNLGTHGNALGLIPGEPPLNTDHPVLLDDVTGERGTYPVLSGGLTPVIQPVQLRQRPIRGVTREQQYWRENRGGLTHNWVNDQAPFVDFHPPALGTGSASMTWSPSYPPIECELGQNSDHSLKLIER